MARSKSSVHGDAQPEPTASQRFWREVRGYAEALAVAFLVVTFVFNTVGVVGSSMRPSLHGGNGELPISLFTGDRVFIPKYDTWLRRLGVLPQYRRGEIVVVREPANAPSAQLRGRQPFFIKRIVAVAGDRVKIARGQVIVNGYRIDQGFITDSGEIHPDPVNFPLVVQRNGDIVGWAMRFVETPAGTPFPILPVDRSFSPVHPLTDPRVQLFYRQTIDSLAPVAAGAPEGEPFVHKVVIPEGHYFVMGDNRDSSQGGSEDSRYFGPIPAMSVAGRATAVIWPPRRDGDWNWRTLTPPAAFADIPDSQQNPGRDRAGTPVPDRRLGKIPSAGPPTEPVGAM